MNSLFAQLFLALQSHITENVAEIKWIDQDLGQLEIPAERPPVIFPCVLIDFNNTQYTDEGMQTQWASLTISIRLGFAPFSSASTGTPIAVKNKALEYYEIENKLYQALQGFDANGLVQPLTRINATTEQREDTYRVRHVQFTTATEDVEAKEVLITRKVSLEIFVD